MKKRIYKVFVYIILILAAVTLTACTNETEALEARIDTLEKDHAELQTTVSSLNTELDRAKTDLASTRSELQNVRAALEAAAEEDNQTSQQDDQSVPMVITYEGNSRRDMTWPLRDGDLPLGLRVNFVIGEEDEIIWHSENEDIFTVSSSEDGMTATVTPITTGDAQLVVTIGDEEARSWVRIK